MNLGPLAQGLRVAAVPEGPSIARRFVISMLERGGLSDLTEDAALLTSELATNAIRHAHASFEVRVHCEDDSVRIELLDPVDAEPVPRAAGPHDVSGRGLAIVDQVAARWGVEPASRGKKVWFVLSRARPWSSNGYHP